MLVVMSWRQQSQIKWSRLGMCVSRTNLFHSNKPTTFCLISLSFSSFISLHWFNYISSWSCFKKAISIHPRYTIYRRFTFYINSFGIYDSENLRKFFIEILYRVLWCLHGVFFANYRQKTELSILVMLWWSGSSFQKKGKVVYFNYIIESLVGFKQVERVFFLGSIDWLTIKMRWDDFIGVKEDEVMLHYCLEHLHCSRRVSVSLSVRLSLLKVDGMEDTIDAKCLNITGAIRLQFGQMLNRQVLHWGEKMIWKQ